MPLPLATISFALCFAAWGLISAFATVFRQAYHLNATSTAFLIATPVLLGALARLPVGMLADRFGGRLIFPLVMLVSAGAAFAVPLTGSFTALLVTAFWLGVAGSSFAVGVGFVSRWTPQERQGAALGVYGLGNIGQSAAVFGGPVLAAAIGWQHVFVGAGILLVVWAAVFWMLARNAPGTTRPRGIGEMIAVLVSSRIPALLSLFYFLTFGGFVAFSIYLPTLCAISSASARRVPASERPGSWCWQRCSARSAGGSRIESAARACSPACSWASRPSRSCSAGTR